MKMILLDEKTGVELVLPVTPASFEIPHGVRIETVNLTELGDVILAGYETMPNIKLPDCLFPANEYPFNQPGARLDPYGLLHQIEAWDLSRTVLRFIISDTMVNCIVLIEDISYGERDGTGDVYVTINLHKYRAIAAAQVQTAASLTANAARTTETTAPAGGTANSYTVVYGDTLSGIARKFYGNAGLYPKLASYNGIKNANILKVGQVVQIPDKAALG